MKVTYIYHSSFAVELEKSMLIFDYYGKGDLPERPAGKQVYFLNSHSHPDHFSRKILASCQTSGAQYHPPGIPDPGYLAGKICSFIKGGGNFLWQTH